MKNTRIYLTKDKWRLLFYALNDFRTSLIKQGRYTDIADEVILKIVNSPTKKIKIS